MAIINVRHRKPILRAARWSGSNEAEIQELNPNFEALDEPCDDDPEATAQMVSMPGHTWRFLLTGDWIVEDGAGWRRMHDDEFREEFEVPDGA